MDNENKNNCKCNHDDNHEHEECGCGHEHEEHEMIQLTLDDDTTLNCFIIGTFDVDDRAYIALLPEDDGEVLLYRYHELEGDEIELSNIEDEKEFNIVAEAFHELFGDDEEE